MRVKTFFKVEGVGETIKKAHSGTSGMTITLDTSQTPPQIQIEYFGQKEELITMLGDALVMFKDYPGTEGVSENAIKNFLQESNMVDKFGVAHIQYKKGEKDERQSD